MYYLSRNNTTLMRHCRRNVSNLFQITADAHPGIPGVSKDQKFCEELKKYSLLGRPSSQNWVKSKTICQFLMKIDAFLDVFLILLNFRWMVDLAMCIFEFLTKFLVFWHPWHPWVGSDLKQIWDIPPTKLIIFIRSLFYIWLVNNVLSFYRFKIFWTFRIVLVGYKLFWGVQTVLVGSKSFLSGSN